jgi:plasmid stability protein
MASITIRNLDDDLKKRLRLRAAEHGRSMEGEARDILQSSLRPQAHSSAELYAAIRADVAPLGGVKLEPLLRQPVRDPPDFSGPEFGTYDDE